MNISKLNLFLLTIFGAVVTACGSMQQMQGASITPVGEKESVIGLSATPVFDENTSEMIVFSVLQYNARHGINQKLDFGYHLNVPVIFGINSEDTPPIAPLLPSIGADLKLQFLSNDNFDMAFDAGINLSFASSANLGFIISNKNSYASVFSHYAQIPDIGFGSSDEERRFSLGYSLTFGHKVENVIYEIRLPVINNASTNELMVRPPIVSIGLSL
ncbi:hypothetical protein [Marinicellulosiphila megalodicopiae]|uniref:hypothetical protein n=1 Tax=Marinicellulosiphila megalodicopiae TaxID=2724896 RepID=UPI003BB16B18